MGKNIREKLTEDVKGIIESEVEKRLPTRIKQEKLKEQKQHNDFQTSISQYAKESRIIR